MAEYITLTDPVEALVEYTLDIKPYHTKIVEVLIEYVWNEDVDVTIGEDTFIHAHLSYPGSTVNIDQLGYGSIPLGSPNILPIISPSQSIAFHQYPAINSVTNSFIVAGDKVADFNVGEQVILSTEVVDYSGAVRVASITHGPAGSASFTVFGDHTATFPPGRPPFYATGLSASDRVFTVSTSTYDAVRDETEISVEQSIPVTYTFDYAGITKAQSSNTGTYTVQSVEYSGGLIDSWTDVTDPSTYKKGSVPHTIVTVTEPLVDPLSEYTPSDITNNDISTLSTYSAKVHTNAVPFVGVILYSNAATIVNPTGGLVNEPDEGINRYQISSVSADSISIDHDLLKSNVFVGALVDVIYDGQITKFHITDIAANGTGTTISVDGVVDTEMVGGIAEIRIPSNVLVIEGDYQSRYAQNMRVDITTGDISGKYTVVKSYFHDGRTYLRLLESLDSRVVSYRIIQTDINGFHVPSDVTSELTTGMVFNVVGSNVSNLPYVVDQVTYSPTSNTSFIQITGALDTNITGSIVPATVGIIKKSDDSGYGTSSSKVNRIDDTLVHVTIDEKIEFSGLSIDFRDDLIVYNVENNDAQWNPLPQYAIVSETEPTIPLSPIVSPSFGDIYIHPTQSYAYAWDGRQWVKQTIIYWYKESESTLHYRVINPFGDTEWVVDVIYAAESGTRSASSGINEIASGTLYIDDIGNGVARSTFELSESLPNTNESTLVTRIDGLTVDNTIIDTNTFTIPSITSHNIGDLIEYRVYDYTTTQYNAFVADSRSEPYKVMNNDATKHSSTHVSLGGGNYIDLVVAIGNDIQALSAGSVTGTFNFLTINIKSVNAATNQVTLYGQYDDFFDVGYIINVVLSNNANYYEISDVLYDSVNDYTILTFTSDVLLQEITEYNPGVQIIAIDNVGNAIQVSGNVVDSFTNANQVKLDQTGTNSDGIYTIDDVTYSAGTNSTLIYVNEDIPTSSIVGYVHSPIEQLDNSEVGIVYGVAYNQTTNRTEVLSSDLTGIDLDAVAYYRNGPVNWMIHDRVGDSASVAIADSMQTNTDLAFVSNNLEITATNAASNQITIDGSTSLLTIGSAFSLYGSFGGDRQVNDYTNDGIYIVKSVTYNDVSDETYVVVEDDFDNIPPKGEFTVQSTATNEIRLVGNLESTLKVLKLREVAVSEPLISTNPEFNNTQVTDVTYDSINNVTIIHTLEDIIDLGFTGPLSIIDTVFKTSILYDDTNTDEVWEDGSIVIASPHTKDVAIATIAENLSFSWGATHQWAIVDVTESNNTIKILGDQTTLIRPEDDVSIVGAYLIDGKYTVKAVTLDGSDTVIEVYEDITAEPPVEQMGLFRSTIDVTNWFQYPIVIITNGYVTVNGNATGQVFAGTELNVYNTLENNTMFMVTDSPYYDATDKVTRIPVTGTNYVVREIIELPSLNTIVVPGTLANRLKSGDAVSINDSANNNGTYVIDTVTYNDYKSYLTITTDLPTAVVDGNVYAFERGGVVESARFGGMTVHFRDTIGIAITEDAQGSVLADSGSFVDSWDYNQWDIGSFDEDLGTIVNLYSSPSE